MARLHYAACLTTPREADCFSSLAARHAKSSPRRALAADTSDWEGNTRCNSMPSLQLPARWRRCALTS
eukprot:54176-Lingulodinium_polyedra.AAC.1